MNIYVYTYALYTCIPHTCTYIHIITISGKEETMDLKEGRQGIEEG